MKLRRTIVAITASSFLSLGLQATTASAGVIGTQEYLSGADRAGQIASVQASFARADVRAALEKFGVNPADASLRVASLTDQELADVARKPGQPARRWRRRDRRPRHRVHRAAHPRVDRRNRHLQASVIPGVNTHARNHCCNPDHPVDSGPCQLVHHGWIHSRAAGHCARRHRPARDLRVERFCKWTRPDSQRSP